MRLALPAATLAAGLALFPLAAVAAPVAQALFLENCASCHGEDGKANTELGGKYMAQDFTEAKFAKEVTVAKAQRVIERGVRKTKMKAWKGLLKPEEIQALAGYVVELSKRP
jgi:mono/diheme cytochrome c family protein